MKFNALILSLMLASPMLHAKPVIDFSEDHQSDFSLTPLYEFQKGKILGQLFKSYVTKFEDCPTGVDAAQTELIESDLNVLRGHFATKTKEELVVSFSSAACPGAHSDFHSNVALVQDLKVVAARQDVASAQFEKVFDLDGDGLSEVVTSISDGNQGYFQTVANTMTFKGGRIQTLNYITGIVANTNCASGEKDAKEVVAVFMPTANPVVLSQVNYWRPCTPENSPYHLYSRGPIPSF